MDGFELGMNKCDAEQRREFILNVDVFLQIAEQPGDPLWRRWHEHRVARAAASHPVLRAPNLTGLLRGAAHPLYQDAVAIVEQADGDRNVIGRLDFLERVVDRRDVIGDFLDVLSRHGAAGVRGRSGSRSRWRHYHR